MYFSKLLAYDIINYATAKGANRDDLCQILAIDLSQPMDPRVQISYDKMIEILNVTGRKINDEFLGLHIGEQMALKATKQVDAIMENSPTIEEAFSNASTYSKLISDALTTTLSKTAEETKVSFEINPNWAVLESHAVQQIIDMTLTCTLKSISWLADVQHFGMEVHLNYPALKKKNEYYKVFDCPVKFNEQVPCIVFQNRTLSQAVRSPNLGLLQCLKEAANEEMEKIQTEAPLIIAIKEIVLNNLPKKFDINAVSFALNLSVRTLQRKLHQLNTNFKTIEKDIIIKLAKKMILFEERNIDEISYLLGFSEASALIRFFKKELNITPKKFKKMKLKNSTEKD